MKLRGDKAAECHKPLAPQRRPHRARSPGLTPGAEPSAFLGASAWSPPSSLCHYLGRPETSSRGSCHVSTASRGPLTLLPQSHSLLPVSSRLHVPSPHGRQRDPLERKPEQAAARLSLLQTASHRVQGKPHTSPPGFQEELPILPPAYFSPQDTSSLATTGPLHLLF